jgi:hypothetical protein
VNATVYQQAVPAILCATIYMRNPLHRTSFETICHPLYTIVPFHVDPGQDGKGTEWEEVHVDTTVNHRLRLRLPPRSDYLLRRVKDVPEMHIGSDEFNAYYENRKEATGSVSTRRRRERFAYHPSHPGAAESVIFRRARAQVPLTYGTMVACPNTPLDPGDSRSVEAHEECAMMRIAMFGNVYGKISPAAQHSDESRTSPASPHYHRPIVAPPDARILHAGETWMDAWDRDRAAMTNKRRRVCDRVLKNNNDIVTAKNTARTEVLV